MSTAVARKTLVDVVREFWPDAPLAHIDYLLWNHTPFPFIGDHEVYRRALATLKATLDAGGRPCETCSKPLSPDDRWFCSECAAAFDAVEAR